MIIKKTRNLKFAMGNFEMYELYATVEVDTVADADLLRKEGIKPDDVLAIEDYVDDRLTEFTESDVEIVSKTTDKEESFVFPYRDLTTTATTGKGHK